MKPFTSVLLAAMLGTTATVALSESANAGSPHDYYRVEVYRVRLPHVRVQRERVYYPQHRREYHPRYIRVRDNRSRYPRVDYREYRYRDYRGDRDRSYDYYEHNDHYWNYSY